MNCQMAGHPCPHDATVTVRLADVRGDRRLCSGCVAWMEAQGFAFRVLEPNAFRPEWRQRDLARDTSLVGMRVVGRAS